ncbi:hypothetical protein DINM_004546 [Dirofilaria immitis]|nr:hypothetical protein [Dirofilaria immitis]
MAQTGVIVDGIVLSVGSKASLIISLISGCVHDIVIQDDVTSSRHLYTFDLGRIRKSPESKVMYNEMSTAGKPEEILLFGTLFVYKVPMVNGWVYSRALTINKNEIFPSSRKKRLEKLLIINPTRHLTLPLFNTLHSNNRKQAPLLSMSQSQAISIAPFISFQLFICKVETTNDRKVFIKSLTTLTAIP